MRGLRDAEVGYEDVATLVEQDIVGLDVAVDDLVGVRVCERVRHLPRNARGVSDGKLLLGLEQLAQRRAVDAPHDEIEDLVLSPDFVNRHDVGMLETRHGLRLAHEALRYDALRRELDVQDLHRHVAIQHIVARAKHRGEAPLTQQRADGKFLPEHLLQALPEAFEIHGGARS